MSTLKVDSIIPTAGVASGGGGGIIQVVQKTKTSAYAASQGSTELQHTVTYWHVCNNNNLKQIQVKF